MSEDDFNALFERATANARKFEEEYVPQALAEQRETAVYIPTPKTAGPQPISIEKYKERQQRRKGSNTTQETIDKTRKRVRGGKRVIARQRVAEIYNILPLVNDLAQKQRLLQQIELEKLNYGPSNRHQNGLVRHQRGNQQQQ